jgi:hypothetical protein
VVSGPPPFFVFVSLFDFRSSRRLIVTPIRTRSAFLEGFSMEALLPIIIQVVTGIIGGQAVGAAFKQAAMGQLPKILAGAVGGVGGGALLGSLLGGGAGMDPAAGGAMGGLLGDVIGGAGGGAILTGIVGAVMGAMKK